jgi:hypothetical protein
VVLRIVAQTHPAYGANQRNVAVATPAVSVAVSCVGNSEWIRVTNTSTHAVKIVSIGSLYLPAAGEPYAVNYWLGTAATRWYYSGRRAGTNVLTTGFLFDTYAGSSKGVRVATSAGNFEHRCQYPSGHFPVDPAATKTPIATILPRLRRSTYFNIHYRGRSFAYKQSGVYAQDAEASVAHIENALALDWNLLDDYFLSYTFFPQPDPELRGLARSGPRMISRSTTAAAAGWIGSI